MIKKSVKINAVLNIVKQCANIIFPLITYPYVSRVLGESNLGKYSFADAILNVFLMTAALGIPTYAIREGARIREDKKKIEQFAAEIFSINLLAMLASYAVLFLLILLVPRLQKDVILTYILSITIIFNILGRDWVNSVFEDFFYLTVRYVAFQCLAIILIFIFVRAPDHYIRYTIIMLIANAGGYAANILYTQKYLPYRITFHLNLKRHLKPILYLFCSSIALFLYVRSDIIILGFFRSDGEVGIYTLASKVYSIIKSLLNAVTIVVIPRISFYLGNNALEDYKRILSKLWKSLITLIMPSIVGLFCLSREIMSIIGGTSYESGKFALQILCIALFFAVFGCFYSQAILVPNRKEKVFFIATIVSALINIVLNMALVPYAGMNAAAVTTAIAEFCVFAICRLCSRGQGAKIDVRTVISVAVGCIIIYIICYLNKQMYSSVFLTVIGSVLCSLVAYYVILRICKNELIIEAQSILKNMKRKIG